MNGLVQLSLKASCICSVPLNIYDSFTFIVNDQNYSSTKIVADLLSSKICNIHSTDPTFNEFTITTQNNGDFSQVLDLLNFEKKNISKSELPFIIEVCEKLGSQYIDISNKEFETINDENIFERFQQHEKNPSLFGKYLNNELAYIATHFYEIYKTSEDHLISMSNENLQKILKNPKLKLESEDQLLVFVCQLYAKDSINANLFEYVHFTNVSKEMIIQFLHIFNIDDLTMDIWNSISERLINNVLSMDYGSKNRYFKSVEINYNSNNQLNGILNYIRTKMPNRVFNEIDIISSSIYRNNEQYSPRNIIQYENPNVEFCTNGRDENWLLIDFKDHRITPLKYVIRSYKNNQNCEHPKTWVIEGSNDNQTWDLLDEQKTNASLNGPNLINSFPLKQLNKKYRFIRMRLLENWRENTNYLNINNFEIFGTLF